MHSANSRARSLRALACIRAGISSRQQLEQEVGHQPRTRLLQPRAAGRLREVADAADIGLALGDADHAARLQRVEHVAGLDRLLIGRDRQLGVEAALALRGGLAEQVEQRVGVGDLEIVGRHLDLILEEDVAVGHARVVELEVEHIVDALDVHRQPLEPVGQLAGHRLALEPADLLEVGELGHFHPVAPDFPAEAPGAERRAFPIVLDEADVVLQRIDADLGEAAEIEVLQVVRARLQHHLILVIMRRAGWGSRHSGRRSGGGTAGHRPRFHGVGPERAQHGRRVERPRPHLHVVGLQDDAALRAPIVVERQDQVLEAQAQADCPVQRSSSGLWLMALQRASGGSACRRSLTAYAEPQDRRVE